LQRASACFLTVSWNETFRASFFGDWTRAGLAESDDAGPAWAPLACPLAPNEPGVLAKESQGRALDPAVLDAVYGFGVFIGEIFGTLFSVPRAVRVRRAGLCGLFNLGISLFDFVCDESSATEFQELQRLPSLRLFTGAKHHDGAMLSARLRYLDRIVKNVLDTFAEELGPPHRGGLWGALLAMFEAEMTRAQTGLASDASADRIRDALRLSSSEPFRVMAQWMANEPAADPATVRRVTHVGRCVGDCFWLIDDAKDVWEDLYAGRWNFFLLEAKSIDPSLPLLAPTVFVEQRLTELWARAETAKRGARWAIGRLARALDGLALKRHQRRAVVQMHAGLRAWH
jgi:hypothetical protein